MTANDNSDGDSIEVPNDSEPIELGSVGGAGTYPDRDLILAEAGEPTYEVVAYPRDHADSNGEYGVGITESVSFEGGKIMREHSLSPEQARELAARLMAAADKLGHVPDDAPQPAEL